MAGRSFRTLWRSCWPTLALVLVTLSFRSAVADWYDVPTGSMQPTIYVGDRILVDKAAYDWRLPILLDRDRWWRPRWGRTLKPLG